VGHAKLELLANRTKVARAQVSWTTPQSLVIGDPARPVAVEPATLTVLPAVVSTSAVPGSTLDLTARVTYDVCRETCLTEAATASIELPVGEGGTPSHEEAFATARIASQPR
jgi:DsbC/DsbD-like thiol-disulfide interchange protein